MDLMPYSTGYSFNTDRLPMPTQIQPMTGMAQVIHFSIVDPEFLSTLLDKIRVWFATRDEVLLVDHGMTVRGSAFAVLEWQGFAIDPLFISILHNEDFVEDYSVYTRDLEEI